MPTSIAIASTKELEARLEEIRELTGRERTADVVRDALELYDLIIYYFETSKHRLFIGPSSHRAGEIVLAHLEKAAGRKPVVFPRPSEPEDEWSPNTPNR